MKYIVGIDEVGRGPLAGPVTLCAVKVEAGMYKRLQKSKTLPSIGRDSKKLSKKDREKYSHFLMSLMSKRHFDTKSLAPKVSRMPLDTSFCFAICSISNIVIDKKGLSFAIKSALTKCLQRVGVNTPDSVLLDGGLKAPKEFTNQKTIIKGDEKHQIIAWASILAKVHRDNYMTKMAKKYPKYGFEKHVGYGTKMHREAIRKYGVSAIHRKSWIKTTFPQSID